MQIIVLFISSSNFSSCQVTSWPPNSFKLKKQQFTQKDHITFKLDVTCQRHLFRPFECRIAAIPLWTHHVTPPGKSKPPQLQILTFPAVLFGPRLVPGLRAISSYLGHVVYLLRVLGDTPRYGYAPAAVVTCAELDVHRCSQKRSIRHASLFFS